MAKLTEKEICFLCYIRDGARLPLATREQDKIRQRMRRMGYAKVEMTPRRWVITSAGRAALSGDRPKEDRDV